MNAPKKTYLGDGLYAWEDGLGQIILSTDRYGIEHWVALEGPVLEEFLRFIEQTRGVKITVGRVK